ncbi:MAG: hypothetical protein U5O39_00210 [Gammaproteobacteria bacterium]|nr:hypothetical protein [Gammaproteobacteria bacterium]
MIANRAKRVVFTRAREVKVKQDKIDGFRWTIKGPLAALCVREFRMGETCCRISLIPSRNE